jgi:two-component system NtrC family sensor kinase
MSVVTGNGKSSKRVQRGLPLLIIEDEPSVMAFLKSALERNGYETVCANSAKAGLELLSSQQFRGIISDMRTPGGVTGADVHKWVTIHRPELAQKILFITGDTVNQETLTLLKKTGAPCIEKPFRVSQLLTMLTHLLGNNS